MQEGKAWDEAWRANTWTSLQQYLHSYPSGTHAAEAASRLDDLAWGDAIRVNNPPAYQSYLKDFPSGSHRGIATQFLSARIREQAQREEMARNNSGDRSSPSENTTTAGSLSASQPISGDEAASFLQEYHGYFMQEDLGSLMSLYGPRVSYFSRGLVTRDVVRKDRQAYMRSYDHLSFAVEGPLDIRPDGDLTQVQYIVRYSVHSPARSIVISGTARTTLLLQRTGEGIKIVGENQSMVERNTAHD